MASAIIDANVTKSRARRASVAALSERYGLLGAFFVVACTFSVLRLETFFTTQNASSILGSQAVMVLLTLGLTVSLRTGENDLSCAATLTLSAMTVAYLNVARDWPIAAAIAVALASGIVVGLANGLIVVKFGVDSFIVTIGMQTLISGLVLWISGSLTISGVEPSFVDVIIRNRLLGIPVSFWIGLIACTGIWYILQHTAWGVRMLFVGRSRAVSRLSGIAVSRTRVASLVLTGFISALAGVVYAGTTGAADPSSGLGFLLPAFAGAFLGATAMRPGEFNAWGSFFAVYFLVVGVTGLAIYGVPSFVQNIFYGVVLIGSVTLSQISARGNRR